MIKRLILSITLLTSICYGEKTKLQRHKMSNLKETISFQANYTKSMEHVNALEADGSLRGELEFESKAEYDFDSMAHTIRGLLVGEGCDSVKYETSKNLPEQKGSIELVIKPFNWEPNDKLLHMFFQTVISGKTPFGKLYIYKYKQSGAAVYLEYNENGDNLFISSKTTDWAKESWHHLVVTYDLSKEIVFYVDGKMVAKKEIKTDFKWPDKFSVGPISKRFGYEGGKTTISNVTLYKQPLTEKEVMVIAKERLPDLKIELDPKDNKMLGKEIGKKSRWYEQGMPQLGLEALAADTVLPPWEPISFIDDQIQVWNRTYAMDSSDFISQITAGKTKILSKPVSVKLNGQAIQFKSSKVKQKDKGRVEFQREGTPQAAVNYLCEFDGLMWCDLKLKTETDISKLELEIPISADVAKFIHYVGAPTKYESQDLPKNSYSKELSQDDGILFESAQRTNVWLGNNECGVLWFAESDQYWWPKDRKNYIQVIKKGNVVTLKLNMITEKLPVKNKEISIKFGLMATPVKPLPKGWRDWTFTAQYDSFQGKARGNKLIYWPNEWRYIMLDPDPTRMQNIEKMKAKVTKDVSEKRSIIPYWTRLHGTAAEGDKIIPEADYMKENWGTIPNRPGGGSHHFFRCANTSVWTDYLVWCVEEWAKVLGQLDGVYMDETQPIPNSKAKSGGGYDALDGTRRPTFETFGSRNMIKRMTYNTWKRNNKLPMSVAHCSATHTMHNLSMYTIMLIGEQYYPAYFKNAPELLPPKDDEVYYYSYTLPMDRLRAECYWKQWGAVMLWLPCVKHDKGLMKNPLTARDMLSRVMQADMLVWPLFCNADEVHKTWSFRNEFGIGDSGVSFTPYWENKDITADKNNVVIGYYKKGDHYLVLISNLNRQKAEFNIQLKNINIQSVKNAETLQNLSFNNGSAKISLQRNDYIALRINY